jgi:uncharacterized protein YdeI (YjbR/CyaY-like superfamily)
MDVTFFKSAAEWRVWLEANHDKATELVVGFYKKDSGRQNMTYQESLDQALAFGWIDGIRRSIDENAYSMRFTPRKPRSTWSAINIKRVGELIERGLMHPAGLKAFNERDATKQGRYSNEQEKIELPPEYEAQFRANAQAWEHFQSRPPSYRKTATWWVISAKQEATRLKRLATLIEDSAAGRKIAPLTPPKERK